MDNQTIIDVETWRAALEDIGRAIMAGEPCEALARIEALRRELESRQDD
jgi:hypothetical protein